MTEIPKVTLKLKKSLKDFDGKVIRDPGQLDSTLEELQKMTQKEAYDKSPEVTVGFVLAKIIGEGITPKTVADNAKLFRLASKINAIMEKDKGEYVMDEEQLKDLKKQLEDAKGRYATPKFLGSIYDTLETLSESIASKKKV